MSNKEASKWNKAVKFINKKDGFHHSKEILEAVDLHTCWPHEMTRKIGNETLIFLHYLGSSRRALHPRPFLDGE